MARPAFDGKIPVSPLITITAGRSVCRGAAIPLLIDTKTRGSSAFERQGAKAFARMQIPR
jgi:hypothetical protein